MWRIALRAILSMTFAKKVSLFKLTFFFQYDGTNFVVKFGLLSADIIKSPMFVPHMCAHRRYRRPSSWSYAFFT